MMRHLLLLCAATAALTACGPEPINPKRQIGAHPYLPEIHEYLLPPMHVVKNVGWGGATPKAADGEAGTINGQRGNDRVHTRAIGQAGVHHGRRLIHAAAYSRHYAINDLHEMPVIFEAQSGRLQPA